MGLFKNLVRTAVAVVELPVEVVKDVTTLGGTLTDQENPYTFEKLKELVEDLD